MEILTRHRILRGLRGLGGLGFRGLGLGFKGLGGLEFRHYIRVEEEHIASGPVRASTASRITIVRSVAEFIRTKKCTLSVL